MLTLCAAADEPVTAPAAPSRNVEAVARAFVGALQSGEATPLLAMYPSQDDYMPVCMKLLGDGFTCRQTFSGAKARVPERLEQIRRGALAQKLKLEKAEYAGHSPHTLPVNPEVQVPVTVTFRVKKREETVTLKVIQLDSGAWLGFYAIEDTSFYTE